MRYKPLLVALLVSGLFLFLSACFNSKPAPPEKDLPEMIGKWYKSDTVYATYLYKRSGGENYPNFEVDYSTIKSGQPTANQINVNGNHSFIRYTLGILKNAEEAAKEQAALGKCLIDGAWKTGALNDRNNQALGTMSICRNIKEGSSLSQREYVYTFIFNNENRLVTIKPLTATNQDLIEFTKALPFNSQADLSMIDSISSLENLDSQKLMSLSPPLKITKEPYLKGKTVIVNMSEIQTLNYIADVSRHAETVNEMQSLIQIRCEKTDKIGTYEIIETKEKVPAYGSQCKVTVIDNTIPAIIAEKTFSNKEMPEYKTFYQSIEKIIDKVKLEYTAPYPQDEVKNFITGLPNR